jgi:carbamoyltransferase
MANILGVQFGHDGSVCIVKDGKLEVSIATERITRKKKDQGFNDDVIDYVLDQSDLSLDDIDCIATNDFKQEVFGNDYIVDKYPIRDKEFKIYIIPHHLAHCASVYYTSPFNDSYCFSMDCSMGKLEANSLVAYGKGKELIAEYCPQRMEGVLYGEVTEKLGLGPALHKAGTTMGLASYGTSFEFDILMRLNIRWILLQQYRKFWNNLLCR